MWNSFWKTWIWHLWWYEGALVPMYLTHLERDHQFWKVIQVSEQHVLPSIVSFLRKALHETILNCILQLLQQFGFIAKESSFWTDLPEGQIFHHLKIFCPIMKQTIQHWRPRTVEQQESYIIPYWICKFPHFQRNELPPIFMVVSF